MFSSLNNITGISSTQWADRNLWNIADSLLKGLEVQFSEWGITVYRKQILDTILRLFQCRGGHRIQLMQLQIPVSGNIIITVGVQHRASVQNNKELGVLTEIKEVAKSDGS